MGKHGAPTPKEKPPTVWARILSLFIRKPAPPTCTWCGATEDLLPVRADDYGKTAPIWVCSSTYRCTKNYWEKTRWK